MKAKRTHPKRCRQASAPRSLRVVALPARSDGGQLVACLLGGSVGHYQINMVAPRKLTPDPPDFFRSAYRELESLSHAPGRMQLAGAQLALDLWFTARHDPSSYGRWN